MDAVAYTLPADQQIGWLEELEGIVDCWDAMSSVAQDAVRSVVESFLSGPDTTNAQIARASALLAAPSPCSTPAERERHRPPKRRRISFGAVTATSGQSRQVRSSS